MPVRRLTTEEFGATIDAPRAADPDGPARLWVGDYFDALPRAEWRGHDFSVLEVVRVWAMAGGRWEHVCVQSAGDRNVQLVLVLDLEGQEVLGHHLLDLNELYGLA